MNFTRTRIAPTPSGFLHLGNAYAFALTAAIAQRYGAKLLLRIDDMDRDRVQPEYVSDIFASLNFLQIHIDEGPGNVADFERSFSQRLRMPLYEKAIAELIAKGLVYACRCSRSQGANGCAQRCRERAYPLQEAGLSLRLNTSGRCSLTMKSPFAALHVELAEEMRDFVVRRKDGLPSYQICSLIDDLYFGVDLIVRGKDLWPSTVAQLYLAACLNLTAFSEITFYHHDLILNADGAKLSKSAGDTSLQFLHRQGLSSAALYKLLGQLAGNRTAVNSFADLIDARELP